MAAAVAKNNPLTDTGPQIRQAAFITCMNDAAGKPALIAAISGR